MDVGVHRQGAVCRVGRGVVAAAGADAAVAAVDLAVQRVGEGGALGEEGAPLERLLDTDCLVAEARATTTTTTFSCCCPSWGRQWWCCRCVDPGSGWCYTGPKTGSGFNSGAVVAVAVGVDIGGAATAAAAAVSAAPATNYGNGPGTGRLGCSGAHVLYPRCGQIFDVVDCDCVGMRCGWWLTVASLKRAVSGGLLDEGNDTA